MLDPARWANPEIPSRQMMWLLILISMQFMGDYWIRHLPPQQTDTVVPGVKMIVIHSNNLHTTAYPIYFAN